MLQQAAAISTLSTSAATLSGDKGGDDDKEERATSDNGDGSCLTGQAAPPMKKRKKKGGTSFEPKQIGEMKGAYTYEKKLTNATTRRKAKPTNLTEEPLEFDVVEVKQAEQRLLISLFYVQAVKAPPPVEWQGEDGTASEIVRSLKLTKNQRKKVLQVITEKETNMILPEWDEL
jgi:hypothetical protein